MANNHWNIDKELDGLKAEISQNQLNNHLNHTSVCSIDVFMATQPQKKLDHLSIENPRLFHYRYGMDSPKAVRQKLIEIQNASEWSDRQIRNLHTAGLIDISHIDAKICPRKIVPITGWTLATIASVIFIPAIFATNFSHLAPLKQLLNDLIFGTVWFGSIWYSSEKFIKPWRILQRNLKRVLSNQIHNLTN